MRVDAFTACAAVHSAAHADQAHLVEVDLVTDDFELQRPPVPGLERPVWNSGFMDGALKIGWLAMGNVLYHP